MNNNNDNLSKTPQWPVGFFGTNSRVFIQDLKNLNLSNAEYKVLSEIQKEYKLYKHYVSCGRKEYAVELLHKIRGLKRALDVIQITEDGYNQQLEWQTLLY